MNKSHWRIGKAVICVAVLVACTNKDNPAKQDTASAKAAEPESGTDKGVWPNPDIILITADGAAALVRTPKNTLRVHMDVVLPASIPDGLEDALSSGNGSALLGLIKATLVQHGTPRSWATLKAALRCKPDEIVLQNETCTSSSPPTGAVGDWPKPNVILLKDYGSDGSVKNILQVKLDIRLGNGADTQSLLEPVLMTRSWLGVPQILVDSRSIYGVTGHSPGWGTLKGAVGCTDFASNANRC